MEDSTLVSGQGSGVGSAPTNPAAGRDVGATPDDLDARFNARIEQVASGFRSVMDRRVGQLERQNQALIGQLQQTQNNLNAIQGYFQQAQEAELDPSERQRRQDIRAQQAWSNERAQLILNARKQASAFKVLNGITELGYKWNDERFDWAPDQYESDPDGWANTVLMNATRRYAQDTTQSQTQRRQTVQDAQRQHTQEVAAQQRVQSQNQERQAQAGQVSTATPSGEQSDVWNKIKQMSHKERLELIDRTNRGILHGEITHPDQIR
jgi:hypothetical protein